MLPPWTVSVSLSIWVFWLISLGYESKCRASMKFCIVCWLFRLNIRKVCPITNSVVNFDCLYFWVRGVRPEWVVESQLLIAILFYPTKTSCESLPSEQSASKLTSGSLFCWVSSLKILFGSTFIALALLRTLYWYTAYSFSCFSTRFNGTALLDLAIRQPATIITSISTRTTTPMIRIN